MNHSKVCLIQDNIFKIFFIMCDCLSHCKMSSVLPPTPITTHDVKISSTLAINQKFLKSPSLGGVGPPKNQYSRLSHLQLKWHFSFPSCLSDPSFSFNGLLFPFSYALSTMAILQGMVLGYLLLPRPPPPPLSLSSALLHWGIIYIQYGLLIRSVQCTLKCTQPYNHRHNHDIEYFCHSKRFLLLLYT